MAVGIVMPKAGNSVEECILSKWRIKIGEQINTGDIIADIETDKSAIEVEATAAGTVLALFWDEGDLVPVLLNICAVGKPGEDFADLKPTPDGEAKPAEDSTTASSPASKTPAAVAPAAAAVTTASAENAPLSPRAKKFVSEHPFVLPAIQGSGAQGRILEQDVAEAYQGAPHLSRAAAAMLADGVSAPLQGSGISGLVLSSDMGQKPAPAAAAAATAATTSAAGAVNAGLEDVITEQPLSNIRKIIAGRLQESLSGMAQYTLNAEADVSNLLALRARIKAEGEKLGLANINIGDMVMYAVIKALLKHPELNGEFANNVLKLHSAVNIGFACDTPRGLMVPVLHHAQLMSLGQMCQTVKTMAKQATDGNLNPDLLAGATFTVSNLGAFGITTFTPVINAPQLAILGVGKTLLRPVRAANGEINYRDYMQFSLTLNHQIIDGAPGARFLQTLKAIIENFELVCVAG